MNIPRLILGTAAVGGLLCAMLLRLQRVEPGHPVTAEVSNATRSERNAEEIENRNRELEKTIAVQREQTAALKAEAARLVETPADFRPNAIGARRKLAVLAQQNNLPPNVLDRLSSLVADKGYGVSEPLAPVPTQMLASLTPEDSARLLSARAQAEKTMAEADAGFRAAAIEIIGETTFEAYTRYLPKISMGEAIGRYFQPALGSDRLTPEQTEALADVLISQMPAPGFKTVKAGAVELDESTIPVRSAEIVPPLSALLNRLSAGALEKSPQFLTASQYAYLKRRIDLNRIAVEIAEADQIK